MGDRKINDVYIILEPWAPKTLYALMASKESSPILAQAFHQGAQGVRYIHSFDIIHRDLKFDNLLVAQRHPLRVVVTDFGHATTVKNSQDHKKGTISYLPPEILELKRRSKAGKATLSDSTLCWSLKSDVYSYGLVGVMLLKKDYFKLQKNGTSRFGLVHQPCKLVQYSIRYAQGRTAATKA